MKICAFLYPNKTYQIYQIEDEVDWEDHCELDKRPDGFVLPIGRPFLVFLDPE